MIILHVYLFVWLFWAALGLVIFQLHVISIQIYPLVHMELWVENNLVPATITGDRAANLDTVCLALTAFSSVVILHTTPTATRDLIVSDVFRSDLKDLWFSLLNATLLANEQLLPILTSSMRQAWAGFELKITNSGWRVLRKNKLVTVVPQREEKTLQIRRNTPKNSNFNIWLYNYTFSAKQEHYH